MALIQSTAIPSGATDYEIDQSLKFDLGRSTKLTKTFASAGNRKTWTWSSWVKRNTTVGYQVLLGVGNVGDAEDIIFFDTADARLRFAWDSSNQVTMAQHRDTSGWYHLLIAVDSTESVADDRIKIYINGNRNTEWYGTKNNPTLNHDFKINNALEHYIGVFDRISTYANLYMGETNFIDGQQLTPADFGETGDYGEWKPVEYSGTYGNNGFYLPFKQDYTVEGFSTVTWKGNDAANHYIGGTGFQPDITWIKKRDAAGSHAIFDSVRGATKYLSSNQTAVESTQATTHKSWSADGFTVGSDGASNSSSNNYVAWNWDMGGSNASNTNGSITSTVRANTTYGQSIVSYDGNGTNNATVGHGLSSAPELAIIKRTDATSNWNVGANAIGWANHLYLNTTSAQLNGYNPITGQASTLEISNDSDVNNSSGSYVAYCFHSVTGYSKFGSYTGNGSTTGPSVTTGFKVGFLLTKCSSSATGWAIVDNTRTPTNPVQGTLYPDKSDAEYTGDQHHIDLNDNGFQIKNNNSRFNTNGDTYIYMAFADKREYAYWLDQSGNNNDWTSNNLTESDISVDSPTNNFATLNPLQVSRLSAVTLSEGNLRSLSNYYYAGAISTLAVNSGKWYWEVYTKVAVTSMPGFTTIKDYKVISDSQGYSQGQYFYKQNNTGAVTSYGTTSVSGGSNSVPVTQDGDIVQFALDLDNGRAYVGINGTWANSSNPANGTNYWYGDWYTAGEYYGVYSTGGTDSPPAETIYNFGQDSSFAGNKTAQGNQDGNDIGDFYYTPPTGFLALCTKNLPDVAVTPSEHFNTLLWSGNGSTNAITGAGFEPSLIWSKDRNGTENHIWLDQVRGNTHRLSSNNTSAETSDSNAALSSFDSDGFTLTQYHDSNQNSSTNVGWVWKANGSGSSNTDGSITSTVSANVDAGFSIVSYTGTGSSATVGHGLSKAPNLTIIKPRNFADNWIVTYDSVDGSDDQAYLNLTNAGGSPSASYAVAQNATTLGLTDWNNVNDSSDTYIAYCFHSVDGYSKVGSYTGNGNTDGTFVYTGFRPAFVMVKITDTAGSWILFDNKRSASGSNPISYSLLPNATNTEDTSGNVMDFTANGFKIRSSGIYWDTNKSGSPIVYIAFAETPFKYSNAR